MFSHRCPERFDVLQKLDTNMQKYMQQELSSAVSLRVQPGQMFLQGISKFQKSKFIIELMKSFPNGSLSLILTFLREKTYFKSRHNESSTHKSLDKIRSFLRIENLIVKFKGFLLLSLLFQVFTRFHHIFLKYKSNRRIFVYYAESSMLRAARVLGEQLQRC